MPHPPVPIFPFRRGRSRPGPRRRGSSPAASLETLEGRTLLSHAPGRRLAHLGMTPAEVRPLPAPGFQHLGQIRNEVGVGHAIKVARFYPYYTGPKLGQINAAGAKAFLDGRGNLILSGIVAGTVGNPPESSDEEGFYGFGIDRGAAPRPGPFPGRPRITFDSYVEVSVQQSGVTAAFVDLTTGTVTPLPAESVVLGNDNVKVGVPTSLLGTSNFTVNFWTQDTQAVGDFRHVASFAPEFRNFPVAPRPF
jgi:hypothetical protein